MTDIKLNSAGLATALSQVPTDLRAAVAPQFQAEFEDAPTSSTSRRSAKDARRSRSSWPWRHRRPARPRNDPRQRHRDDVSRDRVRHHESIMRDGLHPHSYGGPYVAPDKDEAIGYAIEATQEHRAKTGSQNAQAIVYRLAIPREAVRPATSEGPHKGDGEFCVPGGVPRAWFVDAELGDVPLGAGYSDKFAVAGRGWWRLLDTLGAGGVQLGAVEHDHLLRLLVGSSISPTDLRR